MTDRSVISTGLRIIQEFRLFFYIWTKTHLYQGLIHRWSALPQILLVVGSSFWINLEDVSSIYHDLNSPKSPATAQSPRTKNPMSVKDPLWTVFVRMKQDFTLKSSFYFWHTPRGWKVFYFLDVGCWKKQMTIVEFCGQFVPKKQKKSARSQLSRLVRWDTTNLVPLDLLAFWKWLHFAVFSCSGISSCPEKAKAQNTPSHGVDEWPCTSMTVCSLNWLGMPLHGRGHAWIQLEFLPGCQMSTGEGHVCFHSHWFPKYQLKEQLHGGLATECCYCWGPGLPSGKHRLHSFVHLGKTT